MARVFVVGMATVDFVLSVGEIPASAQKYRADDARIVGGGCAANAAVAVSRLKGSATLAARLGDDALADLIAADLAGEGVDISMLDRAPGGRSSFSSVCVDAAGERQIVNFRGAGLRMSTDWLTRPPDFDAVLADTRWHAGAAVALEMARARGVPGVLDVEPPLPAEMPDLLELASHVAFSRAGIEAATGDADPRSALMAHARRWATRPAWVGVTDGANGVYHTRTGGGGTPDIGHAPAFDVVARDTLGAGDIWHGAFALALAEGMGEPRAITFASAAAGLKCTRFGGRAGCPDRAELMEFLAQNT